MQRIGKILAEETDVLIVQPQAFPRVASVVAHCVDIPVHRGVVLGQRLPKALQVGLGKHVRRSKSVFAGHCFEVFYGDGDMVCGGLDFP